MKPNNKSHLMFIKVYPHLLTSLLAALLAVLLVAVLLAAAPYAPSATVVYVAHAAGEAGGAGSVPDAGNARDGASQSARLPGEAQALYEAATSGNRQLVYKHLLSVERMLQQLVSGQHGARTEESLQAVKLWLEGRNGQAELQLAVAQLLLLSDALNNKEQAAWTGYREVVQEDLAILHRNWLRNDETAAKAALAVLRPLHKRIERILPAVALREPNDERLLDVIGTYTHLEKLLTASAAQEANRVWVERAMHNYEQAVLALFQTASARAAMQTGLSSPLHEQLPLRWAFALGTVICSVLLYAGWRKFKGQPFRPVRRPPAA